MPDPNTLSGFDMTSIFSKQRTRVRSRKTKSTNRTPNLSLTVYPSSMVINPVFNSMVLKNSDRVKSSFLTGLRYLKRLTIFPMMSIATTGIPRVRKTPEKPKANILSACSHGII